jgi:hypothetical protein
MSANALQDKGWEGKKRKGGRGELITYIGIGGKRGAQRPKKIRIKRLISDFDGEG